MAELAEMAFSENLGRFNISAEALKIMLHCNQ